MAGKNKSRRRATVVYPQHEFAPEDLLRFVEFKPFEQGWKELGLGDDDHTALQILIMLHPTRHPVVQGTGGLRKLRFAPAGRGAGKSGAVRVGYAYLPEFGTVLLLIAYAKNEQDNLTADEKKTIRSLIQRIERALASGLIK